MALKKVIDTAVGAPAEYWKFAGIEFRYEASAMSILSVTFEVFVDEAKRRANFRPLERRTVHVQPAAVCAPMVDFTNPTAMAYRIAKTTPELADAVDC